MFNHCLILALLATGISAVSFCSSACIDSERTCSSTSFGACTVCAVTVYNMVPDANGCVLLNQTEVRSSLFR